MKVNSIFKNKARFFLQYIPFSRNAIFFGLALWACVFWLQSDVFIEEEQHIASFIPFLKLMLQTALMFFLSLFLFSFLTTASCWLYYLWLKRKNKEQIQFHFKTESDQGISMESTLQNARRPFLGSIKSRLVYDDLKMTEPFVLGHNRKKTKSFWRSGIGSKNELALPDIKEYELKGSFVFFEDLFQLISLPVFEKQKKRFYQAPQIIPVKQQNVKPFYTEKEEIKIEDSRKIPGDYFHYKNFEQGDDIRRIVWKAYAKNREFIVRTPEMNEPYASHIQIFASFHNDLLLKSFHVSFTDEILNFYKENIWSIYNSFSKNKFKIKFTTDQNDKRNEETDIEIQKSIANSNWQKEIKIHEFLNTSNPAVICISSFNNPLEVEEILESIHPSTVIYFIKLSDCFKHYYGLTWLSRIFIQSPNSRLEKIKSKWIFSPLRISLMKREKRIEEILKKSDHSTDN